MCFVVVYSFNFNMIAVLRGVLGSARILGTDLHRTDSNSGMLREFCRDLIASSAVDLPISSVTLRLVIMSGWESDRRAERI